MGQPNVEPVALASLGAVADHDDRTTAGQVICLWPAVRDDRDWAIGGNWRIAFLVPLVPLTMRGARQPMAGQGIQEIAADSSTRWDGVFIGTSDTRAATGRQPATAPASQRSVAMWPDDSPC